MLILFTATIFLGAALLFLVQPMAARMILPQLGGSPAVWNTCMVFFQAALLGGYAYAHWSTRWLGVRRQAMAHVVVVLLPAIALPLAPPAWAPPSTGSPIPWLLAVLAVAIGLPFLVASTGGPLLQRWFASTDHPGAKDPYFLYAASNAGSLLALLAYPAVLEPLATLAMQRTLWSIGYGVFAVMTIGCGVVTWRRVKEGTKARRHEGTKGDGATGRRRDVEGTGAGSRQSGGPELALGAPSGRHSWAFRLRWVMLAFIPSSLMLGVTQFLSTDIAAVPLLWIVPLSLYLLTFILAFSKRPLVPLGSISRILPILLVALVVVFFTEAKRPIWVLMVLHLLAFTLVAALCHGRLARERPDASRLTEFYLLIAIGGVLGGTFNALVAPLVFDTIAEYPIALVLGAFFVVPRVPRTKLLPIPIRAEARLLGLSVDVALAMGLGALVALLSMLMNALRPGLADQDGNLSGTGIDYENVNMLITVGVPSLGCYLLAARPRRFGLGLGVLLFIAVTSAGPGGRALHTERTFFGVYHVVRGQRFTTLVHGTTNHGQQSTDPARARTPLGYYHPDGPMGQVFAQFGPMPLCDRVGLVGLGTGALAAYGRQGQHFTFFEIDPAIPGIAENTEYFTYLRDCKARYDITLGDGRLGLRDHAADGEFGLIVLDAFSSDAIPIHLLTREAIEIYLRKLRPGGLLALHISNQYLDLEPIVAGLAQSLRLAAIGRKDEVTQEQMNEEGRFGCYWVLLSRGPQDFGALVDDSRWHSLTPLPGSAPFPVWTDDYSNILRVLRWD